MPASEQAALLKTLRNVVHDAMEAGADLRDVHQALSVVKAEVNDTLGWRTRVAASAVYPAEPTLPLDDEEPSHGYWEAGDHG